MGDVDRYLESNRSLWDEWAELHARSDWYDLDSVRRGVDKLRPYEVDEVGDVSGLTMLHLQCQIGADSVSWARRGAKVTGVDFSSRAVGIANALAKELGVDATFVCSDVMRLPETLAGTWDVVYTSRGVLGWLPDLAGWARIIEAYLNPGGFVYLTDIHPIAKTLDDTSVELRVSRPYWPRPAPVTYRVEGSYADPNAKIESSVKYLWTHSTGEIITAMAQAGLIIEFFHEFSWLDRPWPFLRQRSGREFVLPDDIEAELPLFFSLRARKK
ncbi:class I SAM-dependent methyltransferase [Frankia sp. AgB1.9]|uniref:class I SAM-dependent methyltransferase n=1 Tax=unclassified Frankia TaxID=2632575 RepID=UPI001931E27C|nr:MULTISPECIES: class I SAM-dependent methyltransferase [unclassified Frankia]MBL7489730.1 class I SAM-dependent methyltransferase [Frankia sp. AgW1.1]MBL7551940.1 class I SAM-dependent methyltransferase [Frankia sp. AgB1.9]MBL7623221.1 class I SAM-dependent methyltransferase [Frankia sp. AgB1.8]